MDNVSHQIRAIIPISEVKNFSNRASAAFQIQQIEEGHYVLPALSVMACLLFLERGSRVQSCLPDLESRSSTSALMQKSMTVCRSTGSTQRCSTWKRPSSLRTSYCRPPSTDASGRSTGFASTTTPTALVTIVHRPSAPLHLRNGHMIRVAR